MFKLRSNEQQVLVTDVIAFIDLMHRWPFQTALKFAYEFYHGNLVARWVNGCVHTETGNYVILTDKGMWYEQNQAYACANLDRLVYLREDIERIEAQNPLYKVDVTDDMYDEFSLGRCTPGNATQLAPEILHILQNLYWGYCVAGKKPFPHPSVIKMWLQWDKVFHTDLSIPGPKKHWRVRPERLIPIFKKNTSSLCLPAKKVIDYKILEQLVTVLRKQGVADDIELGFKLLQTEPELSNSSMIRLIRPSISLGSKGEKAAARQCGSRLKKTILTRYGSKNSHA